MKDKSLQLQRINYIDKIRSIKIDTKENREIFVNLLKDSLIRWDIEELLLYYLECKVDNYLTEKYIGGVGFLLFTVAIDQSSSKLPGELYQTFSLSKQEKQKEDRAIEIRDLIIKDFAIYKFIIEEYEIDIFKDEKPLDIEFHASGTTSYILKLKLENKFDGNDLALKILKYKYIDNATITNKTESYKINYRDKKFSPKILKSGSRYILMEFILGPTLQEYMHNAFINEKNKEKVISKVISELCSKLNYFASDHGIIHCDLNTNNIILNNISYSNDNNDINFQLYLIDFGVNYLLNEKIGSSRALTKARVYIPEEVLADINNASIMSDIYSLGVILLEMLEISREFEYRKFDEYLDNVRIKHPVLASILDDILDKDPNLRLFDLQRKYKVQHKNEIAILEEDNVFNNIKLQSVQVQQNINRKFAHIYIDLQSNLNLEFELLQIEKRRKKDFWFRFLQNFLALLKGSFNVLLGQNFQRVQYFMKMDDIPNKDEINFRIMSKNLGFWSFAAEISHILVSGGFLVIIFRFFDFKILNLELINKMSINFTSLLTGFVLFSFSAIAAEYYQNIFSSLYSKTLGEKGYLNNTWMRFCTFYWPLPILIAYFYDLQWWAYVASFGTFIISINNFLNYQLAKKAKSMILQTFKNDTSQNLNDRLKDFKGWWILMLVYSLGLLMIGICLNMGIIVDEITYLIITLFINIKMWLYNCTENAFNINKTLQFLYTRYNRALKYKQLS